MLHMLCIRNVKQLKRSPLQFGSEFPYDSLGRFLLKNVKSTLFVRTSIKGFSNRNIN